LNNTRKNSEEKITYKSEEKLRTFADKR